MIEEFWRREEREKGGVPFITSHQNKLLLGTVTSTLSSRAMSGSQRPSSSTASNTTTSSPLKNDNTTSSTNAEASHGSKEGVTEGTSSSGAPEAKVGEAAVQVREEEEQEEADVGEPSTEEVVDMEVFGQLLEIVSTPHNLI